MMAQIILKSIFNTNPMNQIYSEEKKDKENTPKTPSKENAWVKTKDPQYKYKKNLQIPKFINL
jgi:hypothetical protein